MKKIKRIAAIIGIVLILSMYIISFIAAIFTSEHSKSLFVASVYCTIVIPVMLYAFILVYKRVHHNDEIVVDAFHKKLPDLKQLNKDDTDESKHKSTLSK